MDNQFHVDHSELLDEIAKRHGIVPQKNEVTLMQLTIYEYFLHKTHLADQQQLNQLNQSQEMAFNQLSHALSNNLVDWNHFINKKAEKLITVGLEENREQITAAKKAFFADLESQFANQQVITTAAAEKIHNAATLNFAVGGFLSVAIAVAGIFYFFANK
jgi:hypothetical protein